MNLPKSVLMVLLLAFASYGFAATRVNINTASAEELTVLVGIGEVKARAIVEYREKNGAFKSIEQLANVKGIGLKTIENNRLSLTIGGDQEAG